MAVHDYNLTSDDVAPDWPDPNPNPFGVAGDHGVTKAKIDGFITRGAANLNSLIRSRMGAGFDVSTDLTDADVEAVKGAIINYAIGRALYTLKRVELADAYMSEYREFRSTIDLWPENLESHNGGGRFAESGLTSAEDLSWGKGVNEW